MDNEDENNKDDTNDGDLARVLLHTLEHSDLTRVARVAQLQWVIPPQPAIRVGGRRYGVVVVVVVVGAQCETAHGGRHATTRLDGRDVSGVVVVVEGREL